MTEDKMVGWHHQLNGHEFGKALGAGYGQGSLACCSPWGHKVRCNLAHMRVYVKIKALFISQQTVRCRKTKLSRGRKTVAFLGCYALRRTDAEAEIPMLWPPDAKN